MAGIKEKLGEIKAVEDKLTLNKVARFAYTNEAYETNDADGVSDYDVNRQQNIPVANADILKVNETILSKGYRTQASSITRMLMNHFLGRISYNLNKLNDNMSDLLSGLSDSLGKPEGIATLDAEGRIPYSQLPESAMEYKGTWDASANTPPLTDGTGNTGDFYFVSVAGTHDFGSGEISFFEGDRVIYDGTVWQKLSGGSVRSVNEVEPDQSGNITLDTFGVLEVNADLYLQGTSIKQLFKSIVSSIVLSNFNKLEITDRESYSIQAMCSGNNNVIMVGESGRVTYSNGASWKTVYTEQQINMRDIAYGKLIFLSPGGTGTIYKSNNNGRAWTTKTVKPLASYALHAIAFGNNRWITGGSSGKAAYSDDKGETWTETGATGFNFHTINSIAYGNGRWIMVGDSGSLSISKSNGETWDLRTIDIMKNTVLNDIEYGNGRWIVVGDAGKAFYSDDDGENWTLCDETAVNGNKINTITYGNGRWIIGGNTGNAAYSDDNGTTWKNIPSIHLGAIDSIYASTYFKGRWFIAGAGAKALVSIYSGEED